MKLRQNQNRAKGMTPAEKWLFENFLKKTTLNWTHQAQWGFRLFDFWNAFLGVAIEVDGPEHRPEADLFKDETEWGRSKIVTFRVRNFNRADASLAMGSLQLLRPWKERRLEE